MIRATRTVIRNTVILAALPLLLLTGKAGASNFEISRLAAQLNHASTQLAIQLRDVHGYASVRFSADRLSRESERLVQAVSRSRSLPFLRSRFNDIARRYHDLEKRFLRVSGGEYNTHLYNQVGRISYLFSSLNDQFFYGRHSARRPLIIYHSAPVVKHRGLRRPHGGFQRPQQRHDRRDYGSISATRPMQFDHRSPVLERQHRIRSRQRADTQYRRYDNGRYNRFAEPRR